MKLTETQVRGYVKRFFNEAIKTHSRFGHSGGKPKFDLFSGKVGKVDTKLIRAIAPVLALDTSFSGKTQNAFKYLEELTLGDNPDYPDLGSGVMKDYATKAEALFQGKAATYGGPAINLEMLRINIPAFAEPYKFALTNEHLLGTSSKSKKLFDKIYTNDTTGMRTFNKTPAKSKDPLDDTKQKKKEAAIIFANLSALCGSDQEAANYIGSLKHASGTEIEIFSMYVAQSLNMDAYHEDGSGRDLIINPDGDEIIVESKRGESNTPTTLFNMTAPGYKENKYYLFTIAEKVPGITCLIRSDIVFLYMSFLNPVVNNPDADASTISDSIEALVNLSDPPASFSTSEVADAAAAIIANPALLKIAAGMQFGSYKATSIKMARMLYTEKEIVPSAHGVIRQMQILMGVDKKVSEPQGMIPGTRMKARQRFETADITFREADKIHSIFGLRKTAGRLAGLTSTPGIMSDQLQIYLTYCLDSGLVERIKNTKVITTGMSTAGGDTHLELAGPDNYKSGIKIFGTDSLFDAVRKRIAHNLQYSFQMHIQFAPKRISRLQINDPAAQDGQKFIQIVKFVLADIAIPGLLARNRSSCLEYVFEYLTDYESTRLKNEVNKVKNRAASRKSASETLPDLSHGPQDDELDFGGMNVSPSSEEEDLTENKIFKDVYKKLLYNSRRRR